MKEQDPFLPIGEALDVDLPFAESIFAGFPSPAEDIFDGSINLNKELISNPNASFFARVKGDSMTDAGIDEGDVLIIDKSAMPKTGGIAVCFLNGEFTVKKLKIKDGTCTLLPANNQYPKIPIQPEDQFEIWGMVTYIIKKT